MSLPADEPKGFDPQEEYRSLLQLVAKEKKKKNAAESDEKPLDVYQQLMAKERRVLDTVDRVVNDAEERRLQETVIHRMPVHEILMRTIGALRALWDDLIASTSVKDVLDAISDRSRMPFLGISLISISVFIAVVNFVQ